MRLMPFLLACPLLLASLSGCGTKTPLTLPAPAPQKAPPAQPAAPTPALPAEPRQ